jgi:hypothetical protein
MKKRLAERLAALASMGTADLGNEWGRVYGMPAPRISPDLMRLGIAWRMQERKLGGLGRDARLALKSGPCPSDAEAPRGRKLTPGTRLVRDWHGVGHVVTVLDSGFEYEDRHWSSLTAIARHITGAKWSGPRFFGLRGACS